MTDATEAATRISLALFQPDIPQNTGTILRLGACVNVPVEIIEPCGFPLTDASLKRSGMDYLARAAMIRHASWNDFNQARQAKNRRLVLLSTRASTPYTQFRFAADDILLLGRESAGVPDSVHEQADERIIVPMAPGSRSLNVAVTAAMIVGEALRQTNQFPAFPTEETSS